MVNSSKSGSDLDIKNVGTWFVVRNVFISSASPRPHVKRYQMVGFQGLDPGEIAFLEFPFRLKESRK
jgi:hypothetical protein